MRTFATAVLHIDLDSGDNARRIYKALKPETRSSPTPRSKVDLKVKGDVLVVDVKANDTAALRASINSYCRWVMCLKRVIDA
ncbi:MAG: KEOPS complex subunit Pcc1 [Candidatus Bathyarchaeota archaeon]